MKKIILTALVIVSLKSFGQVIADPAVSQMRTSTIAGNTTINANTIPSDNIISLKIPVFNKNLNHSLPSGTCKIKIGLGSKMVLDPLFDLGTVNTSNYFHWTAELYGGQIQITGELIAQLPANFSDTASFNVKGVILGNSTITTNFLVTNHNTTTILSDEEPNNNTSFLPYIVIQGGPIPVTFTKIAAIRNACTIRINFDAEREINVTRYEIEISKDGIHYAKISQLAANNLIHYQYDLPITAAIKAAFIYVRIRSVDFDGTFQYSETRKVSGNCDNDWRAAVYPNPATQNIKQVTITAGQGIFNGRYTISLFDIAGKLLITKEMSLVNATQFNYETPVAAGQYIIKVLSADGNQSAILKFQKL